jgi:DNA repair protein RadD
MGTVAQTIDQKLRVTWPHQAYALAEVPRLIEAGVRRICVTTPTGGGKTYDMQELARTWLQEGLKVVLYSNRKALIDQTSQVLLDAGMYHGIRAADYQEELDHHFQVSSIQTEGSRVFRKKKWELHKADRVLVDEAHQFKGDVARKVFDEHANQGAGIIGFTATPLGIGDLYDHLVIAGTNSELRNCGALVLSHHYGPDEPDLRHVRKLRIGEDLSEGDQRKVMGAAGSKQIQQLFGRVLHWFQELNPDHKPTILFAPGVEESIWFAQQFDNEGITAAHIDGENVWSNGMIMRTSREVREDIFERSKHGSIRVLCNRFVLREGLDCPWLAHGIFATVFGSLQSYLQAGGRLLRASDGLGFVTIQDHGGNWHRHGSLNADRHWELAYTGPIVSGLRAERLRAKQEREPVRCPQCSRIIHGTRCTCGFEIPIGGRTRPVVQVDGSLKEMRGDIYKPRRISQRHDADKIWEKMYYRARSKKWNATFNQAEAMFAQENGWFWPPRDLPLMPVDPLDFFRRVSEVPRERLRK